MGTSHGKNGRVKVSATLVAETRRWRVNQNVPFADMTAQGDSGQTHHTGIPVWTAEVEASWNPADTNGQEVMSIGAEVEVEFYPDGTSSGKTYMSGTASVVDRGIESAHDDGNRVTVTLQGQGVLSQTTV